MIKCLFFTLFICVIFAYPTKAATWDEPWHDEVMRISESFVKVKITANQDSGVKAEVIKFLAGVRIPAQIELRGYSKLTLGSISSSDDELQALGEILWTREWGPTSRSQ